MFYVTVHVLLMSDHFAITNVYMYDRENFLQCRNQNKTTLHVTVLETLKEIGLLYSVSRWTLEQCKATSLLANMHYLDGKWITQNLSHYTRGLGDCFALLYQNLANIFGWVLKECACPQVNVCYLPE